MLELPCKIYFFNPCSRSITNVSLNNIIELIQYSDGARYLIECPESMTNLLILWTDFFSLVLCPLLASARGHCSLTPCLSASTDAIYFMVF